MKKFALFLLLLIFCASPVHANIPKGAKAPDVEAHGAILMDARSGRVLWGHNEHDRLAMASTTKIMTAVLALESGKQEDIVTVSKRAATTPKVKMSLTAGEKIRMYDLMLALMLESSNDAAVAVAEHIGGTVEGFCEQMTAKAIKLGAKDTIFATPNGLDEGIHHSTAYDMAVITRYALGLPGFLELANTPSAKFKSDTREYEMTNFNRLLNEYPGANGVKTGYTGAAGHCLVGAAKRDGMQLISVVLASGWGDKGRAQKWADTKALLDYGFKNYFYETIIAIGEPLGEMPVTRSRSASVDYNYAKELTLPLTDAESRNVDIATQLPSSVAAPVNKGDKLGLARIAIGGKVYTVMPIVATEDAARHDLKTSCEKVISAWLAQACKKTPQVRLPEVFPDR
jgi:D-alanyl-D-alanine carboxypeptidase (penicillin-binding protein 5/6)